MAWWYSGSGLATMAAERRGVGYRTSASTPSRSISSMRAAGSQPPRRMSSKRIQPFWSSGLRPAQAFMPKLIGSVTPSMTQASPSAKCSILGARSRSDAGTRPTQRSGGSLT